MDEELLDDPGLDDGDKLGQKVVVAQAAERLLQMKNIMIGIIHRVMNFMDEAVGSLEAAWFAVVIRE